MVARGLGASGYGDLNFLLGSFAAIAVLLEMGTSSAFYTFISARRRGSGFFAIYTGWLAAQFVVTLGVIGLLLPAAAVHRIWLGHERGIVLLTFAASFGMNQGWTMVIQLGEALRRTVLVQTLSVVQAAAHLGLILVASRWGLLTVANVAGLLLAEYLLLSLVFGPRLVRACLADRPADGDGPWRVVEEFRRYCAPLVVYAWVSFFYAFADRWLLQRFGGATQQAFFSIGQQFASISLLAATSVLRVFWKEVAEARQHGDTAKALRLYHSLCRGLYFVGAWISCLLIPYSREIVHWTLGSEYDLAWPTLAVMFLFPIHQAIGQLSGTYFYASADTRSYARIGLATMALSLPVTYLVLASRTAAIPGLELGAIGLATKLVALQAVGVSLQTIMITGRWAWARESGYQVTMLAALLIGAAGLKWALSLVASSLGLAAPWWTFAPAALLYLLASLAMVWSLPRLAGLNRDQLRLIAGGALPWLRPSPARPA